MPSQISSKEVLQCLNYLGYNNINAQQLKEFIQDLKKLIKYEERKKQNISSFEHNLCDLSQNKIAKHSKRSESSLLQVFNALHAHGTCASNAKVVPPKKESVIAVQIKKKGKCQECVHNKENINEATEESKPVKDVENAQKDKSSTNTATSSKKRAKSSKSLSRKSSTVVNGKSDPVTLYHYYKTLWEQQPIPGEDDHSELRWAIREKMTKVAKSARS